MWGVGVVACSDSGPGQGGAESEVRAKRVSTQWGVRRGILADGLAKQGLSAAGSGSPDDPFHESTGPGTRFEFPVHGPFHFHTGAAMKTLRSAIAILVPTLAVLMLSPAVRATPSDAPAEIRVDIPVVLKKAKVVFNMDHSAFVGDTPIGLRHMQMMVERFKQAGTEWRIAAIFHGTAGYMLLNDEAYNAARMTQSGNPYKGAIAGLIASGVEIEECAVTMKANHWINGNLLPGVKVNAGANLRIVQLVQDGYVMLQP
jgi:intracellular sulfur oxidation DsrE/DsrF family protein